MKKKDKELIRRLASFMGWVLLFVFFIMPVLRLIIQSARDDNGFTLDYFLKIFSNESTWIVLRNTIILVFSSTIIATIIGITFAWIIAYTDIRFKKIISIFIVLPIIIPSYITTLSWVHFYGKNGFLLKIAEFVKLPFEGFNLYSMSGMILVMAISTYPFVYLFTVNNLRKIPPEHEFASRIAGANKVNTFFKVNVPMAIPGISSGIFIAFLSSLDNFGIPAFLGIPANKTVLTTLIYQKVIGYSSGNFNEAAVLSVVLGMIALLGHRLQNKATQKSIYGETQRVYTTPRINLKHKKYIIEIVLSLFFILTTLLPLLAIILMPMFKAYGLEFKLENLSFDNYVYVFSNQGTKNALYNSLRLSVVTSMICLLIGTIFSYFRTRKGTTKLKVVESIITLPYSLPGTVYGLALIITWLEPLPGWNPGIYGTLIIIWLAYTTRFMVLQIRNSISAFQQVDPVFEDASRICGSNSIGKWKKILLPLTIPSILNGTWLIFNNSLTELTMSTLLYSSKTRTIGVTVQNLQQAGQSLKAAAFSSVIVILMFISYMIIKVIVLVIRKGNKYDYNT